MSDTERCENCGSDDTIPVWSEASEFRMGLDPEYIGCLDCHEMERTREKRSVGADTEPGVDRHE